MKITRHQPQASQGALQTLLAAAVPALVVVSIALLLATAKADGRLPSPGLSGSGLVVVRSDMVAENKR